jgi:hypothetical protein
MDANDEVIKMIFDKTLKENPRMTAQGLGVKGGKKVKEAERKKLEGSFNEFKIAIEYLRAIPRIEIFKKRCELHAADLKQYYDQSVSTGTIVLAGRALGVRVMNYGKTKVSFFDRNQKEALQDWKDEPNTSSIVGGDE